VTETTHNGVLRRYLARPVPQPTMRRQLLALFRQSSTGVTVARNRAFDNAVLDLLWDGVGVNTFENNHCDTSAPAGLCEHDDGNGH
jgi:hypothetical protein